jgi:hypothetical protein
MPVPQANVQELFSCGQYLPRRPGSATIACYRVNVGCSSVTSVMQQRLQVLNANQSESPHIT